MDGNKIINVAAPVRDTDGANKSYVDSQSTLLYEHIEEFIAGVDQTEYTLQYETSNKACLVSVSGVVQAPSSDGTPRGFTILTINGESKILFSEAPPEGSSVVIMYQAQ